MTNPGPTELSKIGCDPAQFQKFGPNEYHGPCPVCGGRDRFVLFTNRPFPHWNYMCRVCTPEGGWIDQLNKTLRDPLTQAQRQEFARQRQREEAQRAVELAARMKQFTTDELWSEWHRRMVENNRQWWRQRGINDDWQDYLQLGFIEDKSYRVNETIYHSPAYTIPYLRAGMKPVTLQYRLTDPHDPADKYRFEPGLPSAWYNTTPNFPLTDGIIICEGAIKAIVTKMYMTVTESLSVLAVPSKNSWAGIAETVKDAARIWVILDPDGQTDAQKLAATIGKNSRIVSLPGKIDDMINCDELDESLFRQALKTAARGGK